MCLLLPSSIRLLTETNRASISSRRPGNVSSMGEEQRRVDLQQRVFVVPPRIVDEVILEAAKPGAVLNIYVASFERVAQQTIDQELVPIDLQDALLASAFGAEQIASKSARNKSNGKCFPVDKSKIGGLRISTTARC